MKEQMKKQLIKDIIVAVVAWAVVAIILVSMDNPLGFAIPMGLFFAGLPFGWRWASKIFTATSLIAILIKFILAMVLGWIALPITIIIDIIHYVKAEE